MRLYLSTFSSRNFRNLEENQISLHPRFNLFVGENGQGKTNLLEAIYYLLTLRPLRAVRPKQLIAWEREEANVQGELRGRTDRKLYVNFNHSKRQLRLNNAPPLHLDDYLYDTQVVAFTPEDLQLVRGSPDLRRRFLDRAIFHSDIKYLSEVRQYLRILEHRNALLKQRDLDPVMIEVIDRQFVYWAARLIWRRLQLIARLTPIVQEVFASIFPDQGIDIDLRYQGHLGDSWEHIIQQPQASGEQQLQDTLLEQFLRIRKRECERKNTLLGPHLDDLNITFQGRPFKASASQGQTRGLILTLKIAEIRDIETHTQQHPILILDDVAGELDSRHAAFLFQFLEQTNGQVLLSTTNPEYIQLPNLHYYPQFFLHAGHIVSDHQTSSS